MKIIDFRVRPPMGGILKTAMYANAPRRDRFIHQLGMKPAPSAQKESVPMLLKEMKAAGVVRGVVMAMAVTRQKENETDDAPWGFRAGRADALQAVGADDSNVGERRLQCVG